MRRRMSMVMALLAAFGLSVTAPALAQPDDAPPGGWQFEITPYLWLTGFSGDVQAGGPGQSVSASFPDILKSLDFALMGMFQARKGRVGFLFDGFYANLSKDGVLPGSLETNVRADFTQQIYSFALSFQALKGLDIVGGARVMLMSSALEVTSGILEGEQGSGSGTAVDGFLGARLVMPLANRLGLKAYADIGTGGTKLSWQALGGLSYQLSKTVSAELGYRYLGVEADVPELQINIGLGGLYLGAGIRF